MIYDMTYVSML